MTKLLEFMNSKTNGAYHSVKLVSAVFSELKNLLTLKLVYKKDSPEPNKKQVYELVEQYVNNKNITLDIRFKKSLVDEQSVAEQINNYILNNYKSVYSAFDKRRIKVEIKSADVFVEIGLIKVLLNHLHSKGFVQELTAFLNNYYFENFIINIYEVSDDLLTDILSEHKNMATAEALSAIVTEEENKYFSVSNNLPLFGEIKETKVGAISNIKSPEENLLIAGVVKFVNIREFTSKKKTESGEAVNKRMLSFMVQDAYGKINCVFFPVKADADRLEELKDDMQVIVQGSSELYNDKLNFKARQISLCSLPEIKKEEEVTLVKSENENYIFVKPTPYVHFSQKSLFDASEQKINTFLETNDIVCFDIETTGLEALTNEIIEIGAIKISKGRISETFSALIKPKKPIPPSSTAVHGITDEMVANALSIEQVMPDFYKFTRGCTLTAYNIAFDYNFINIYAKKLGYKFDNRQIDTMFLARSQIKGIKNYKLQTVADKMGVSLENAHRAVNDAIATAEVFIKLSDAI